MHVFHFCSSPGAGRGQFDGAFKRVARLGSGLCRNHEKNKLLDCTIIGGSAALAAHPRNIQCTPTPLEGEELQKFRSMQLGIKGIVSQNMFQILTGRDTSSGSRRVRMAMPMRAKPASIIAQVEASGTGAEAGKAPA